MKDFAEILISILKAKVGDEISIRFGEYVKQNDQKLYAINLVRKGENISKNIYLEYYYYRYITGESLESIADSIVRESNMSMISNEHKEKFNNLLDYATVKDNIIVRVYNYESNIEFLKDKPYVKFLDMAVVFYLMLGRTKESITSAAITKTMCREWGINIDYINNDFVVNAVNNTERLLPAVIISLSDVLEAISNEQKKDFSEYMNPQEYIDNFDIGLYVLTNAINVNGSSALLYRDIIKNFAEQHNVTEVIIIPSSIHELLLIPLREQNKDMFDYNRLNELVCNVNNSSVASQEVLSNHIYMYDYESNTINYRQ